MTVKEKMELLGLASAGDFKITYTEESTWIECEDLAAEITEVAPGLYEAGYYLGGCYNSGRDYLEIDVDKLQKLKRFCELLMRKEK